MICPECLGCGWRPYFVETLEGEEERAWELCHDRRTYSNGGEGPAANRRGPEKDSRYAAA